MIRLTKKNVYIDKKKRLELSCMLIAVPSAFLAARRTHFLSTLGWKDCSICMLTFVSDGVVGEKTSGQPLVFEHSRRLFPRRLVMVSSPWLLSLFFSHQEPTNHENQACTAISSLFSIASWNKRRKPTNMDLPISCIMRNYFCVLQLILQLIRNREEEGHDWSS